MRPLSAGMRLLLALLVACEADDPQGRDDTTNGPDSDAGLAAELVEAAVLLGGEGEVLDIAVSGDDIVILCRRLTTTSPVDGTGPAYLHLSEDRGETFRTVQVEAAALAGLEPFRVHAARGRIWFVVLDSGTLREVSLRELDLGTLRLGEPILLGTDQLFFGEGTISGFEVVGVSGATTSTAIRVGLGDGSVTRQSVAGPGGCVGWQDVPWHSLDGETFVRTCYRAFERCVQRGRVSTGAVEEVCLGWRDWPIPWFEGQREVASGDAVWRVWNDGGRLLGRELAVSGATPFGPELELGRGVLDGGILHSRYEGVVVLGDGRPGPATRRRIAAIGPNGLVALPLPELPCSASEQCRAPSSEAHYGALGGVAPLGGERWLGVYRLAGGNVALVVREGEGEPPTFEPPDDVPAGVGTIDLTVQPGDTPLERACALVVACPGGQGVPMESCLGYWQRVRAPDPQADPAFERFIATPPGDCAALASTFPALTGACTARCLEDGRAIDCEREAVGTDTRYREVHECAAVGAECVMSGGHAGCRRGGATCRTCDAQQYLQRCDEGGVPESVEACGVRGLVCDGSGLGCVGDVFDASTPVCDGLMHLSFDGTRREPVRRDCARARLPCQREGGCGWEGVLFGGVCTPGVMGCDEEGRRFMWCSGGLWRFVECSDVGASRCAEGRCVVP